jgi:hypothetical protein
MVEYIKLIEVQGPRGAIGMTGATGATGAPGAPGSDANVPTNVSAFVNDAGYITAVSTNTLINKVWQGSPILDAYIASAANWNSKQAGLGFTPENSTNKGVANGYCPLDPTAKVPSTYLPAYVDEVIEYPTKTAFPATGQSGVMYVALDTNNVYRWGGTVYVEIAASPGSTDEVPEGATNLYYTVARVQSVLAGTNVSAFLNDAGYITASSTTTLTNKTFQGVPIADAYISSAAAWNAKQSALPVGSALQYYKGNQQLATFPTAVSAFTNDANYMSLATFSNSNFGTASVGLNLDGQGSVLSTGQKGYVRVPFNGTITGWSIISDVIGSAVFDVWKSSVYPTSANTITGSAKPTLNSSTTGQSTTLTGWTTAVLAGDIIGWNLDSASTITRAILQLTIIKS